PLFSYTFPLCRDFSTAVLCFQRHSRIARSKKEFFPTAISNRKSKTENRRSTIDNRKSTMKKAFIFNKIPVLLVQALCFHGHSRFAATFPQPSTRERIFRRRSGFPLSRE